MAPTLLRDYRAWHDQYEDPNSPLAQRLLLVRRRLGGLLTAAQEGPIRILSLCAGQGRDILGVLPNHARRADVSAVLVELDPENVRSARDTVAAAELDSVEVVEGDAAVSDVYAPHCPVDLLVACGIFGNVSDADVENTARTLSMLCRPGAAVIWTRHRREPDLNPLIKTWFAESGFLVLTDDARSTHRGPVSGRLAWSGTR